jgi:hypothetical protein
MYDYMYPVDLENNERSCEYSAIQYVAKSIATCKKKSLYNQPKPYFFKKILWSNFWIDFNKFYTKSFRMVYILIVYLLIMFIWVVFICP